MMKKTDTTSPSNSPPLTRGSSVLNRETFETSRCVEFFTEKELRMQIGHSKEMWALALVKELIDNALDACETEGVAPEITVTIEDDAVTVEDNGPGIPQSVVERSLDYMVRVSDKAYYVSPTRGQLGNALKCVYAAPYVVTGERSLITVEGAGVRHDVEVFLDHIEQAPRLKHHPEDSSRRGTLVRFGWPELTEQLAGQRDPFWHTLRDESVRDVSTLLENYSAFNPHATFRLVTQGMPEVLHSASDPGWSKWRPTEPTSPHWYTTEQLIQLMSAYVAHERRGGRMRTVREFVGEFRDLRGSKNQKAVTDAAGLTGKSLADLVHNGAVDAVHAGELLAAMKQASKPVKPERLGVLGKNHLCARLKQLSVAAASVRYKKVVGEDATTGLPHVVEVGFAVLDGDGDPRRIVCGLNWTPTLSIALPEVTGVLQEIRVDWHDPVVVLVHVARPHFEFVDRGKTQVRGDF